MPGGMFVGSGTLPGTVTLPLVANVTGVVVMVGKPAPTPVSVNDTVAPAWAGLTVTLTGREVIELTVMVSVVGVSVNVGVVGAAITNGVVSVAEVA